MTTGTATASARTHRSVTRTDPLRLFRTRLSAEPFNPSRPPAPRRPAREHGPRAEPHDGEFTRSFALPSTVEPNPIQAAFTDGLHDVTPPQREEAPPKPTEVSDH